MIDDDIVSFDELPIIKGGRTFVPMRKTFEKLGCQVEWIDESKTIIATKNSKVFAFQIDKCIIILIDLNSLESDVVEIECPPIMYNNKTMIPVRAISELLGCVVEWESESQTVRISTM